MDYAFLNNELDTGFYMFETVRAISSLTFWKINNFNQLQPRTMHRGHTSFSMSKPYTSLNLPKKFPEDIECVIKGKSPTHGSLYISNIEAAQNLNTLKKFQIGAVLTCAKGYQLNHPTSAVPLYKYIATIDHESCDISLYFDEAADFIKKALAETNLLVHCIAGVSRSVSMAIAFLIREQGMTYDQAYKFVKSRRKIIHPNDGFIALLKKYQQKVRSQTPAKEKDLSPQLKPKDRSDVFTPTKTSSNYHDKLSQYPSSQLTPQPRARYEDKHIDRYQSTQLTPNKTSTKDQDHTHTSQSQKYKYDMYLTSNYDKFERHNQHNKRYIPKTYETLIKTPTHTRERVRDHNTVCQKIINIDPPQHELLIPKCMETSFKDSEDYPSVSVSNEKRKKEGYFDQMNKELSQKIDEIRKKYDGQRQKLYQKYQNGDKKYIAAHTRDDQQLTRSPLLRHNYATVENRNKSVNDLTGKKQSYLETYQSFKKDNVFERNNYQGHSDLSGRGRHNEYFQAYSTSTKDYFYSNKQTYFDKPEQVYTRKFNLDDNEQQNIGQISCKYDELRKKIDHRLKNYGKYERVDPYGQKSYSNYLNRYPSHYGYRNY